MRDSGRIGGWHVLIVLIICVSATEIASVIWEACP